MNEEQKIDLNSVITRNPEIIFSAMDDEIVMMSVNQGLYFGVDKIGARIWQLLENPHPVEELIVLLTNRFNVSREDCERDTLTFLNDMLNKKVILVSNTSGR